LTDWTSWTVTLDVPVCTGFGHGGEVNKCCPGVSLAVHDTVHVAVTVIV